MNTVLVVITMLYQDMVSNLYLSVAKNVLAACVCDSVIDAC